MDGADQLRRSSSVTQLRRLQRLDTRSSSTDAVPQSPDRQSRSRSRSNSTNRSVVSPPHRSRSRQSSRHASSQGTIDPQAQYIAQEHAYVHKLRSNLLDDYYGRELHPVGQVWTDQQPSIGDEYGEADDDEEDEFVGLGGVGTSFDDAYTDLSRAHFAHLGHDEPSYDKLRERTEWQTMLTSVVTGEVYTSEKSRLRGSQTTPYDMNDEERWIELKARVCGRSIAEQRRFVAISRSTALDVLEKLMAFRLDRQYETIQEPFAEVGEVLNSLSKCEALWPIRKKMQEVVPLYTNPDFLRRVDALTSWHSVTQAILLELKLLQEWTGNEDADPTLPPTTIAESQDAVPLVERVLKQDDALTSLFKNRIERCIFPLMERARICTSEFADQFLEMGLPLFLLGLEPVMAFPVKVIREIIQLRLRYARRLVNPTMVIIDQTILRFQNYMTLGLVLTEEYQAVTRPILDKGWVFSRGNLASVNSTMLECITFYLELLSNKFLDGGRTSLSFFRSFKSIEQLEQHYNFLQETCRLIEGGDISVAERFTSLHSRVLSRLLAYWEHQMEGPQNWTRIEIERWFAATIENIRSIQRKLLRFYKVLSDHYENAAEFSLPQTRMKEFIGHIQNAGFFLVFVSSLEYVGVYTFASPNLRDHPETIKNILQGHCRLDSSSQDEEGPGAVLVFSIDEPLVWDGDYYTIDMNLDHMKAIPSSRVRLVAQGGFAECQAVRQRYPFLDTLNVIEARKSHLARVDTELQRIRTLFYRLATTVISSAITFRQRVRSYEVQETVQSMFVFAREFGQRGLPTMGHARRGRVALKLIDLCIDWVSFVCDDCPPSDQKTFKWTVVAMEFAMVMTRGVNIVAISDAQFTQLRRKVADCITLLISHFDIMGARSKAAATRHHASTRPRTAGNFALKDDDEAIALQREHTLQILAELDESRPHMRGKVLDDTNTEFEFLSFASSTFSNSTMMRWQQGRFIGSGAFGSVYEAVNLDSGQVMAVKEVRLHNHQSIRHVFKSIKDEMTVLEMLSHPNIVQYFGVEVHRERVFIFMEYCEAGSLARLLEHGRIQDEMVTQLYSLQMLEGLAYLHQSGIVHRDIKPENILLDHLGVVKFVDFGAAKIIANRNKTEQQSSTAFQTRLGSLTGTPMYMSPEVITGKDAGRHGALDIWSIGCCILQMVTGRRPWANLDNDWAIMYHIAANQMPLMPNDEQASRECQSFLLRTLERDPTKRPSAMELLNDPWILPVRNRLLGMTDIHS